MDPREQSEALHGRVRAFIEASLQRRDDPAEGVAEESRDVRRSSGGASEESKMVRRSSDGASEESQTVRRSSDGASEESQTVRRSSGGASEESKMVRRSPDGTSEESKTVRQAAGGAAGPSFQHGEPVEAADTFDALAVALARYQAARCAPVARLFRARGADVDALERAAQIPAVPCDVFRFARVAAHPKDADERVFRTSGTSLGAASRGEHPFRNTATYELAALSWGARMLWPDRDRLRVLILAPPLDEVPDSSLGFMIDRFAARLGGPASWHVRGGALDAAGFARACAEARASNEPAIVLGTSFAFVHLLEAQLPEGATLLPDGSRAMQTGGFKGRSREVPAEELRAAIARSLGVPPSHVVGEYGMTELSSQLYEGTIAAARAPEQEVSAGASPGVYLAPPWVRVTAVDPETLAPLPAGEVGLARIVDLANVDSAVAIQTADRVRVTAKGVELLGRASGAPPRGCSIAIDQMLGGAP